MLTAGYRVRVLDSLIPQVHGDSEPLLPPDVELLKGDIRNVNLLDRALIGIDGVFHLAVEVGVGQSMYEIARYVGGNDLGTAVLLERLAIHPVCRLVVASSMSVYGEGLYNDDAGRRHRLVRRSPNVAAPNWDPASPDGSPMIPMPTDETKQVDLASIYALTKCVQERSCQIFGAAYGVEVIALRLFNVFGPGQALSNPYTGVLANFGARLLHGQRLWFRRRSAKRLYVRDVARAFRLAMENPLQPAIRSISPAGTAIRSIIWRVCWEMRWTSHICSRGYRTRRARVISAIASPISARRAICSDSSRAIYLRTRLTSW